MMLLVCALLLILTVLLACITSVDIPRARLSAYELKRLLSREDAHAIKQHKLETHHAELATLFRIKQFSLLLIISYVSLAAFGWVIGILITLAVVLLHSTIARLPLVIKFSRKRADAYIPRVLSLLEQHAWLQLLLRGPRAAPVAQHTAHSRDELIHLIESTSVITHQDKEFLLHAFEFDGRTVDELMVLRADVQSVEKDELLGPLVLNDLHKTGHHSFPVTDKTLDTVVGTLYLRDMLLIDSKAQTVTAEQAMENHVAYTHQHDTLRQALAAFLEHRTHILIVIGAVGDVVGLLTLDDVIEALFGQKPQIAP